MHYYDHALLSAHKWNCNINDTLRLHKLMDSSKHFMPASQHRLFSHNQWFIQVLVDLLGDVTPNTLTGGVIPTRDVLFEHCREDHNGRVPSLQEWLECIHFMVPTTHRTWFNLPSKKDKDLLQEIKLQQQIIYQL